MRTSYDQADPRLSCYPKRAYATEKAARAAAARTNNDPASDHAVVPYACLHCGQWHTGRKPGG